MRTSVHRNIGHRLTMVYILYRRPCLAAVAYSWYPHRQQVCFLDTERPKSVVIRRYRCPDNEENNTRLHRAYIVRAFRKVIHWRRPKVINGRRCQMDWFVSEGNRRGQEGDVSEPAPALPSRQIHDEFVEMQGAQRKMVCWRTWSARCSRGYKKIWSASPWNAKHLHRVQLLIHINDNTHSWTSDWQVKIFLAKIEGLLALLERACLILSENGNVYPFEVSSDQEITHLKSTHEWLG